MLVWGDKEVVDHMRTSGLQDQMGNCRREAVGKFKLLRLLLITETLTGLQSIVTTVIFVRII